MHSILIYSFIFLVSFFTELYLKYFLIKYIKLKIDLAKNSHVVHEYKLLILKFDTIG